MRKYGDQPYNSGPEESGIRTLEAVDERRIALLAKMPFACQRTYRFGVQC